MSAYPDIKQIEQRFRSALQTLEKRRRLAILLTGFTVISGLVILLLVAEQWLYLSPWVKSISWILIIAAGITAGWWVNKMYRLPDFTKYYRTTADRIGIPGIRHILDLSHTRYDADSEAGFRNTELLDEAIRQNLREIAGQDPGSKLTADTDAHAVSGLMKQTAFSAAATFLLLMTGFFIFGDAFYRSSTFWSSYQQPVPYEFTITPGDTTIEQGSAFQVRVHFEGDTPDQVRLGLRSELENQPRIQGMTRQDGGIYYSRETELFEDAEYFLEMDGFRTDLSHVRVELLPRLQDLTVISYPPSYTGESNDTLTYPFNRMEVLAGSEIRISSGSNKPLESLNLIAENSGDTLSLDPEPPITAELTAASDERYHFEMRDRHDLHNNNPFRFRLSVIEDQPPFVEILSPDSHVHEFISETVPLLYEYEDDHGFTSAELHYRLYKAFVEMPVDGSIELSVPERTRGMAEYDWDVSNMELGAMDRLEYWIEITDNNEFGGYQTSSSSVHTIEIPSLASRFFDQEEKEEEIDNRFSEVEDSYRRMQEDLERLREEIRTSPDDDWEQSQLLDEIQDQRTGIEEQIDELREQFEQLTRDMEQQELMSEETVRRYQELQQLMEEIDDPEILRLLEEMQENLGQFDQSELREQLDRIEFNEERYRERLERTMELFKSLRLDADLDKASQMLEDLAQRESTLSEQESYEEEEVRQQEQIREQMQDLSETLQALPERSPQRRQEQVRQLSDDMQEQMDDLDQQLQENIEQMQDESSDPNELRRRQQDMSRDMEEMSQQLAQMRQEMQQQTISINMQALRYILETLMLLAEEQEDVARKTSELTSNSPGFIDQARRQRNITGQFTAITDSLYRVSTEIPQFSNRINDRKREIERQMNRAIDYLIERNRSNATAQERTALGGLNEVGTMVADLINQLDQMGDGDGEGQMSMQQMMEQMQQMSEDQQQLNQQIQDFINDLQGERLTHDHMERLEQMARQQNQIREQMRELQRRSGRDGDRLMSEMERLAEEMEDAINDLRGGSTDDLMVERQQNILSRMLEVEESVHQRDEDEEERLGESADDYDPREVPEMTMEELRERIRSGVQQTDYTRFREDYRELIERYFQLMEDQLETPDAQSRR